MYRNGLLDWGGQAKTQRSAKKPKAKNPVDNVSEKQSITMRALELYRLPAVERETRIIRSKRSSIRE